MKLSVHSFSLKCNAAIFLEYLRLTSPGFLFLVEHNQQVAGAFGAEGEHDALQDGR